MRPRWISTALLVLVASAGRPAQGQFGNIKKKAQDAATNAATPGQPTAGPTFDDVMIELKEDVLTRVVAGMRARRRVTAPGGATPEDLVRRATEAYDRRTALLEGKEAERSRYEERTAANQACRDSAFGAINQQHGADLQRRMMVPGSLSVQEIQSLTQASVKVSEQIAAGDTAGARRTQADMMKVLGVDAHADTARVAAKCGSPPPVPPWLRQADSLAAESNRLFDQARELRVRADSTGAAAARLTAEQFAVADERVVAYVQSTSTPPPARYSDAERAAIRPRADELKQLVN